jgi:hypothetical protein
MHFTLNLVKNKLQASKKHSFISGVLFREYKKHLSLSLFSVASVRLKAGVQQLQ